MGDEGIGCRVAQFMARRNDDPGVEVLDAGSAGMRLLHLIAGRTRVIIIDCALMDEPAGTMKKLNPANLRTVKPQSGFSLHEGDVLKILDLADNLGELPGCVVVFGIEPVVIKPGDTLSPLLASRVADYAEAVETEVARNRVPPFS